MYMPPSFYFYNAFNTYPPYVIGMQFFNAYTNAYFQYLENLRNAQALVFGVQDARA